MKKQGNVIDLVDMQKSREAAGDTLKSAVIAAGGKADVAQSGQILAELPSGTKVLLTITERNTKKEARKYFEERNLPIPDYLRD